ncbi:protein LAZ1 homolog 1-like isoform X1 [Glycine soja]|uniref:Protein LAZ1-like 1 isoform C n=1 Tax=Glycine soja TaxID=3848 RepID=A0A445L4U1_GLYSO|nr:protein LAZ1 homolog 1-like isoform X1 [Glycine soja]XP_028230058.1 protein LAZ1 homolog 1-like isoform X1 [Glycine soja]XP_028230059.1 protein LAZ1 homolog 1-like isoform X1 [Glycine soja]RZC18114.1 Protein LAZ1-like 1 isoform C [Glycine soja]
MGLLDIVCSSIFLFTLVEATGRSGIMWPLKIGVESTGTITLAVFSSSIFVLVALVLSTYLIFEHLAAYNQPEEQKFLIGLILMVPVYALESFLSLLDSSAAFNCEVIRDCYEAFALYCFERYLIACLGGEDKTIQFMESMSLTESSTPLLKEAYAYGVVEHPFPVNCFLRDWYLGPDFYQSVKIGIVQYIVDDMKFTVSHVVEPVERGIAKINKTFHQISENVKRHEDERRKSTKVKDDSYLVALRSWRSEFSDVHDRLGEGSVSDSGLPSRKRQHLQSKASASRMRR